MKDLRTLLNGLTPASPYPPKKLAQYIWERGYIHQTLEKAEGNVSKAARLARMDRKNFYDIIKKHDIDLSKYRMGG